MTRFRELRLQRGLSQYQLCKQYNEKYNRNYTAGAMSLIENNKRSPELGALLDFADFYDVSLDYLLGRDKIDEQNIQRSYTRTWHLSEELKNIVLGLYIGKNVNLLDDRLTFSDNVDKLEEALKEHKDLSDININDGRAYAMGELKRLDSMSEAEENLEMLRSLLKQSVILAKRVEKNNKSWYRY